MSFALHRLLLPKKIPTYDIMPVFEMVGGDLWNFIKDKDAFKQLVLDGKFGFEAAGLEGEIP